jgi:beta-lactamase superfamily II metal-dependent hydrolase
MENVETYMDDIIIWSDNHEDHMKTLQSVLEHARSQNLKLNKNKCEIAMSELIFLGDKLTASGVKPDEKK